MLILNIAFVLIIIFIILKSFQFDKNLRDEILKEINKDLDKKQDLKSKKHISITL